MGLDVRGDEAEQGALVEKLVAFEKVLSALAFYGDPDSYFAIGFFPDPPCGEFMKDFSEHGDPNYQPGDRRPGRRAREAIAAWVEAAGQGQSS